jgi:hypothetical protein
MVESASAPPATSRNCRRERNFSLIVALLTAG